MGMMKWPLMRNNITLSDRFQLAKFVLTSDRFTNGKKVREFESKWRYPTKWFIILNKISTTNTIILFK